VDWAGFLKLILNYDFTTAGVLVMHQVCPIPSPFCHAASVLCRPCKKGIAQSMRYLMPFDPWSHHSTPPPRKHWNWPPKHWNTQNTKFAENLCHMCCVEDKETSQYEQVSAGEGRKACSNATNNIIVTTDFRENKLREAPIALCLLKLHPHISIP
jgi:hypothetical protein